PDRASSQISRAPAASGSLFGCCVGPDPCGHRRTAGQRLPVAGDAAVTRRARRVDGVMTRFPAPASGFAIWAAVDHNPDAATRSRDVEKATGGAAGAMIDLGRFAGRGLDHLASFRRWAWVKLADEARRVRSRPGRARRRLPMDRG